MKKKFLKFIENNLFWLCLGIMAALIGTYFYHFASNGWSNKSGEWGTFGDFVGGITNPIIALAVLWYVYNTFKLQKEELTKTKEALENSYEEQKKQTEIQKLTCVISIKQTMFQSTLDMNKRLENRIDKNKVEMIDNNKNLIQAKLAGEDEFKTIYEENHEELTKSNSEYLKLMHENVASLENAKKEIEELENQLNAIK